MTVEALEGRKLAAHVAKSPCSRRSSSGVVSYDVTFQLDQLEAGLKPGMSATAEVVVKQAEGVNVPTSAISGGRVTVVRGGKQVRQACRHGAGRQQLDDHPQRPEGGRSDRAAVGERPAAPPASPPDSRGRLAAALGGGGLGGGGGLPGGGGGALLQRRRLMRSQRRARAARSPRPARAFRASEPFVGPPPTTRVAARRRAAAARRR